MNTTDIYSRVWFETIDAAAETGMSKADAEAQAVATLMVEVNAGRLTLDLESAVLSQVRKADGLRKAWYFVDAADLDAMNEIRYRNYRSVRDSFQEFNGNVIAVRPIIVQHGTMGAAYEAGAFGAKAAAA